tara:strand:- start:1969 stop:2802 length:834 start_codon:yes stop_codon:yes gene_type:complete
VAESLRIDNLGRVTSTAYDLTHCRHAIGATITLSAIANDAQQLLSWFGYPDTQQQSTLRDGRDRSLVLHAVERWMTACGQLPPSPPLLHSCALSMLWRQHSPLAQGDLVASLLIGDRWGPGRWRGSIGGLVACGLKAIGGPWKQATGDRLERFWLAGILAGARAHLDMERRLLSFAGRATLMLERRKRSDSLKALLLFAMARPSVTSAQVAKHLNITTAGAIKLLGTAVKERLLIEQTGQASFRRYAVPISGQARSRMQVQKGVPILFAPDLWSETT